MNSLYQQLQNQQQNQMPINNNLKQLINSFKNSNNPQAFLNNYIKNNPQLQNVYFMLQNSNKSPKDFFYLMAK
jgi:hypothetical protein